MTLRYTLPAMVVQRNRNVLTELAGVVQKNLGMMVIEHTAAALAKIFLLNEMESLDFLVNTLGFGVTVQSLLTSCIMNLVVTLIIEMGEDDQRPALAALRKAYTLYTPTSSNDLSGFLRPLMLGIISHLNDALHDLQGKKTLEFKRKIIRSLGRLIETVGHTMSAFAPQVGPDLAKLI